MTYEQLKKVNSEIKYTDIKNKDYAEVPQRVQAFRKLYPEGKIKTKLVSNENGVCVIKAKVYADTGLLLATGYAYEKEGNGFINKTSYIENCETSAVGRALGFLGIGSETSLASYEEVANAKLQQNQEKTPEEAVKEYNDKPATAKQIMELTAELNRTGANIEPVLVMYKCDNITQLTQLQCSKSIETLKRKPDKVK